MHQKIIKKITLVASILGISSAFANTTSKNGQDNNHLDFSGLTAQDQSSGSKADIEITRKIRRHLTTSSNLSTNAKNVKIITLNGIVTLRGPVENQTEKTAVANYAAAVANKKNVHNELDITTNDLKAR